MKQVLQTLFFHLLCIILFALLYFYMAKDHLITHDKKFPNIIDTVMYLILLFKILKGFCIFVREKNLNYIFI